MKHLEVVLTQTYKQKPLAVIGNMPGWDAEMTPSQMRGLAAALEAAAAECEARPMGPRSFMRVKRSYPLGDPEEAA